MTMFPSQLEDVSATVEGAAPEDVKAKVEGRSLWQLVWRRIRRSKVAMASLGVIFLIILLAIFAPLLTAIEGQDPYTTHNDLIDIEAVNGRDIFARIAYGARVSLTIAILATLVSVVLGTLLGAMAAYFGGWVDTLISRTMDLLLAFPQLLLLLTLTPILQDRLGNTFLGKGSTLPIVSLVVILGFFGWPYLARIVRGQVLSLREREFVEAARAIGASPRRIVVKEILPNVVAVVLVYATLAIPTNITAEAALSFLGVGVRDPTPSWGQMLNASQTSNWYQIYPWYMLVPGTCLLITVLAFNLLGDAVRDALDPRAGRS
jgi:peptide/nickel transport system permease protein